MTHLRHRPFREQAGFVRAAVDRALRSGRWALGLGGRVPAPFGRGWAPVDRDARNDDGWDSALLPHPMSSYRSTLLFRPASPR
ncbi:MULTISPECIES: hypothetical protein [Actinosynnema]|uniref:hypothetical protein n=1 Tax=Actinosynnema TaxID=40566 RepID=UPI0020A2D614|nr:hypothetical protein [Actinosynnema pretiosum]MCP2095597.1 hypothetical protein [Actinosynnema pretiosum]